MMNLLRYSLVFTLCNSFPIGQWLLRIIWFEIPTGIFMFCLLCLVVFLQPPVINPAPEKAPKKAAPKTVEKKGKAVEVPKEAPKEKPLDPIAEKLRQQRYSL